MSQLWRTWGVAAAVAAAVVITACGGSGEGGSSASASSPASPSSPATPSLNVCGILAGTSFFTQGIVSGTECSQANTPVVKLNLYDSGGFAGGCTGTVIAPRAVLTAAHCLAKTVTSVRIFVGTGDQIPSASYTLSPRYTPSDASSLDVAVVFTDQDLGRTPLALLTSRDARVGERAVIAGWGNDVTGAGGNTLRAGTASISAVGGTLLETGYAGTGSAVCSGDSGGPLLLAEGGAWAIAGVTSATSIGGSCAQGTSYYANIRNADIRQFVVNLVPSAVQR